MIPSSPRQVYQALRPLIDDVRQIAAGGGTLAANLNYAFVWRPGAVGPQPPNTFTTWPAVYAAMTKIPGPKLLEVDSTLAAANVPAGNWTFTDQLIITVHDFSDIMNFLDGATLYAPNLVVATQQLTSTSSSPVFTLQPNTIIRVGQNGGVASLAGAAPFFRWPVAANGTCLIAVDQGGDLAGPGPASLTVDAGGFAILTVTGQSFIGNTALAGAGTAFVLITPDCAIGTGQTIAGLTVQLVNLNKLQELSGGVAAAATIAQNSTGTITRMRGGNVRVTVQATFQQEVGVPGTTTMQITRDGAPLAGSPTASIAQLGGGIDELSITWLDTIPDFLPHHYGWTATTSGGTIAVAASQASVSVREDG
jgi:hypothetical protein